MDIITSADICRGSNWGLFSFAKFLAENLEK
jgi:hypothetical protein